MTRFASRAQLFEWLVELERLDTPPERQDALGNGWQLFQLAVREDRVSSAQADHLARLVAELKEDSWIAWDYQVWPRDAEPPATRVFTMQHLQRCDRIRITPEGYAAWAARRDTDLSARAEPAPASEVARDVFLCHAGEDKNDVARPLAEALRARGYSVWFDEFELALGDSLRRSIDGGLASSRFGLVVLSPSFFNKRWPQRELDGLTARETGDDLVILPIWHQVDEEEVRRHSPPLADRVAARTEEGSDALAERVAHAVNRRRGLAPSSTGSPPESSPAVAPSGGINPPATGQAEPPLPTEREMLDEAIPPPGAPDHRMLYDGSLLLRLVARPAPVDAQTPPGSDARALLERATSQTLSHAERSWHASVRSGLLMQTLISGWSAGEPRVWQAGRTTGDAEELARRPTAAAVLRTRPLFLSVERTHPTRVVQRGGGPYHAGHDPWIVADSATVCALIGAYTRAISAVRFVDLLVQIGAAPTDQPLASAESYAPESDPFAEPDEGVSPTPPFAPHRYLGLARATPAELVDQPEQVARRLLDDWLVTFRQRDALNDLLSAAGRHS